jgi:hypothetical protein
MQCYLSSVMLVLMVGATAHAGGGDVEGREGTTV